MTATRTTRYFGGVFFRLFGPTIILSLTLSRVASAERLPLTYYTKADGLGSGEVHRIILDSRGFLWFCTATGLSWFDGYRFHAYNLENPVLSIPTATDMLESAGAYWVATNGYGVWRFEKDILSASLIPKQRDRDYGFGAGASQVLRYPVGDEPATNRVNVLYKDKAGRLWAGTDGGLFRFDGVSVPCKFRRVELHLRSHSDSQVQVWALLADPDGSVWAGTKFGLARIFPDGHIAHYDFLPSQGTDNVYALLRISRDIY